MFGTYNVIPEGTKCASAPDQVVISNVAHTKLMCVQVSLKISRAKAGSIPIPIHIFPELNINIDPSSVTIYQTMPNNKFERTIEPSQGPWGLDFILYPVLDQVNLFLFKS